MFSNTSWKAGNIAAIAIVCVCGLAAGDDDVSVTIYSSADPASFDPQRFISQQNLGYNPQFIWQVPGFGVVKETRKLSLQDGFNELRFTGIAQFIDPTTVSFTDIADPDATTVLEQNFEFDLVNPQKVYRAYVDREIKLTSTGTDGNSNTVLGRVLSVNQGQFVIETPQGIEMLPATSARITLPPLPPNDLVTRPTLVWKLHADGGGDREIRTTYQTNGITWRSDYNLVLNEDDTQADLGAWVTLMNLSGTGYKNATLKLIAGDVRRIQPQDIYRWQGRYSRSSGGLFSNGAAETFSEKSFFEYHMYTLPRRTDILTNTTQQITLFPTARDAEVEKVFVYYGLDTTSMQFMPRPQTDRNLGIKMNEKVDVYVRFQNEEDNNLGMPLPAGKVRVYKRDEADGAVEFVGEDLIDHTPRDEEVLVQIGSAFDIVGERIQTDFEIDHGAEWLDETIEITLRNHKDDPVDVIIKENMYRWLNWEIVEKSADYKKTDSRTVHFEVNVPAHGEKTITYKVHYTW